MQCNMWDDHRNQVIAGKFKNIDDEKAEHHDIQAKHMLPFMQECRDKGFKYADLMGIIPSGFKTDWKQRQDQLATLKKWVDTWKEEEF